MAAEREWSEIRKWIEFIEEEEKKNNPFGFGRLLNADN